MFQTTCGISSTVPPVGSSAPECKRILGIVSELIQTARANAAYTNAIYFFYRFIMANKTTKKAPRARRTNAERSATTRNKLIQAAINILYRSGYSATTTIEVAKQARVSRGAMLHQFPTRVDMLLAVARHIVDRNAKLRAERLGGEAGVKRFFAAADVSWEVHSHPGAIALLEIMMATRSDRDLRRGFAQFSKTWMDVRKKAAMRMATDLGVDDTDDLETLITLRQACLRGLSIELIFLEDRNDVEKARQLLATYDRFFADQLVARQRRLIHKVA